MAGAWSISPTYSYNDSFRPTEREKQTLQTQYPTQSDGLNARPCALALSLAGVTLHEAAFSTIGSDSCRLRAAAGTRERYDLSAELRVNDLSSAAAP
jgi:hypothetical protein